MATNFTSLSKVALEYDKMLKKVLHATFKGIQMDNWSGNEKIQGTQNLVGYE